METPSPLRMRRKALNLTLSELARKVGVTEGQLSRIERFGGVSAPIAVKLQEVTGVSVAEIVSLIPAEDLS